MDGTPYYLGELDADQDEHLKDHFVEISSLEAIRNYNNNIIFGAKGSGKTALRRALSELYDSDYCYTKVIDLDSLSFTQVHSNLLELNKSARAEVPLLARNIWQNFLAFHCLDIMESSLQTDSDFRIKIKDLFLQEAFKYNRGSVEVVESDSNNQLLQMIESLMRTFGAIGTEENNRGSTQLSLSSKQSNIVHNFPLNPLMETYLETSSDQIEATKKKALICIDGLDSIIAHSEESRHAIFAGLIDAVTKFSKNKIVNRGFCIKAFLPMELAEGSMKMVWDADKFLPNIHRIRWTKESLREFIRKRLLPYTRTKSSNFNDIWYDIMPEKIENKVHNLDENSFDYILRHTLYRPRQLLMHVQNILNEWNRKTDARRVDPTFIPHVVSRTNIDLARLVVHQLETNYPNLQRFMRSWTGSENSISYTDFSSRAQKFLKLESGDDLIRFFERIFSYGLIGIPVENWSPDKSGKHSSFYFGCVGGHTSQHALASLDENDPIVIHPLFQEFCNLKPSKFGVINAFDQN